MKKFIAKLKLKIFEDVPTPVLTGDESRVRKRLTVEAKLGVSFFVAAVLVAVAAPFYPMATLSVLQAAGLLFAAGAAAASLLKTKGTEETQIESPILKPTGEKEVKVMRRVSREARMGIVCLILGLLVSVFAQRLEQYFTNKRNAEAQRAASNQLQRTEQQVRLAQQSLDTLTRLAFTYDQISVEARLAVPHESEQLTNYFARMWDNWMVVWQKEQEKDRLLVGPKPASALSVVFVLTDKDLYPEVTIPQESELFPDASKENFAAAYLNNLEVVILITRKVVDVSKVSDLHEALDNIRLSTRSRNRKLHLKGDREQITLSLSNTGADSPRRIPSNMNSLTALVGCQLWVEVITRLSLNSSVHGGVSKLSEENTELEQISIKFSGHELALQNRQFQTHRTESGWLQYEFRFPQTQAELLALLK